MGEGGVDRGLVEDDIIIPEHKRLNYGQRQRVACPVTQRSVTSTLSLVEDDPMLGTATHGGLRVRGCCRPGIGKGDRLLRIMKNEFARLLRPGVSCTVGTEDGEFDAERASASSTAPPIE